MEVVLIPSPVVLVQHVHQIAVVKVDMLVVMELWQTVVRHLVLVVWLNVLMLDKHNVAVVHLRHVPMLAVVLNGLIQFAVMDAHHIMVHLNVS